MPQNGDTSKALTKYLHTTGSATTKPPPVLRIPPPVPDPPPPPGTYVAVDESERSASDTSDYDLEPFRPEDIPLLRKPKKPGLRIDQYYGWSGSSYDDYDVITVHGLRDDYRTAWTTENGTWWVRNELFSDISARELDYSYTIEEGDTIYNLDGIDQHARTLLRHYSVFREKLEETETDRPILWICHDIGGAIVKQALVHAMYDPHQYGKIAMLTTTVIFLQTPHTLSYPDLEDDIYALLHLPGPAIKRSVVRTVDQLAKQVHQANTTFCTTKLLERIAIFNVYCRRRSPDVYLPHHMMEMKTYWSDKDRRCLGHLFEASGTILCTDVAPSDLTRDADASWIVTIRDTLNSKGCRISVNYRLISEQTKIMSLAPPTKLWIPAGDPAETHSYFIDWIRQNYEYTKFIDSNDDLRLLHLHTNGNRWLDIASLSRAFYQYYDYVMTSPRGHTRATPEKAVLYFEFDARDSRYRNLSFMLVYFISIMAWRFDDLERTFGEEMAFLSYNHAWTLEDIYHCFSTMMEACPTQHQLTFFIGCFDQCPDVQRIWFLKRLSDLLSRSDKSYRIVLSTSDVGSIAVESITDSSRISLDECPALRETSSNDFMAEVNHNRLHRLLTSRPIYKSFEPQLSGVFEQSQRTPVLGDCIMTWLQQCNRGGPKTQLATKISSLFPVTPVSVFTAVIESLEPHKKAWAKLIFNFVKHAAEPWSLSALAEALAIQSSCTEDPRFDDLDLTSTAMEIERIFCGLITIDFHGVKFSQASFYDVAEMGVEGSPVERAAKVNSTIAETCLRYFWVSSARDTLLKFSPEHQKGGPCATLLDAPVFTDSRTGMAEYAVRFWPQHYRASGVFKPRKLVDELFSDKEARAAWEIPFYVLSNPYTRIQRSYISRLPVLAMLGLEDLVVEQAERESHRPLFQKDRWYAVTEAARAGNQTILLLLLDLEGAPDVDELSLALSWGSARGEDAVMVPLLGAIPNMMAFRWPLNLLHRAAAAGLQKTITRMIWAGCDINQTRMVHYRSSFRGVIPGTLGKVWPLVYESASPLAVAAWWNQASLIETVLKFVGDANLEARDETGSTVLLTASIGGDPHVVQALLRGGARVDARNDFGLGAVQVAVASYKHRAVELLLETKPDLESTSEGAQLILRGSIRLPLVLAADLGSRQTVRLLLQHGANPNIESDYGTALHVAVKENHLEIAQMLLENDVAADPSVGDQYVTLLSAIRTRNTKLVSLLIDHGAEVNLREDPQSISGQESGTALGLATSQGDIEMVRLLIARGADINYAGETDLGSPLFTAVMNDEEEIARLLLEEEADATWTDYRGWNSLHAAFDMPELVPDLLESGVDIDCCTDDGTTVLHMAAMTNRVGTIERLLEHRPKPDLDKVHQGSIDQGGGYTALLLAFHYIAIASLKVLLEAGADPHFRAENGDDAVTILLRWTDPDDAEEVLRLLLSKPYSVSLAHVDDEGNGILHRITEKTRASLLGLMIEAGALVNERNDEGYTPLAIAVKRRNIDAARKLIDKGARIDVYHRNFGSILHLACKSGSTNMVQLLLDRGADLGTVDPQYGRSLLYDALLIEGSAGQDFAMVRFLVEDVKVPINKLGGRYGYPIILATHISRGATRMLKYLIRHGAKLEVADDQGRRAVHHAAHLRSSDVLRLLLHKGASMTAKDNFGRMPIHFAAASWSPENLELLLSQLVDANVRDQDDWTPLHWAALSGHDDNIAILAQHNPNLWIRGRSYDNRTRWSALKLAYFAGRQHHVRQLLVPKKLERRLPSGRMEKWSGSPHKTKPGNLKKATNCSTCLVRILGIAWSCIECHNIHYCFKCYGHKAEMHNAEHLFMEKGPLYAKMSPGSSLLCRKPAHGRLSGKIKRARNRSTFYEVIDLASDDEQRVGDLSEIDVSTEEYDEDEDMDDDWDDAGF